MTTDTKDKPDTAMSAAFATAALRAKDRAAENAERIEEAYANAAANSIRRKLPNLRYPTIVPVRADKFILDLSESRQRDPEKRQRKLTNQFGENGEKLDMDDFEVITAIPRENGLFFPAKGMGRVWSVINLLKRPDLELPTLIKQTTGDQVEKRTFVQSQTTTVPIKSAELFMTYGNMEGKDYELHRVYVRELNRLGLTTVPGHGGTSLTLTAAIFALRLGKLEEAYNDARRWFYPDTYAAGRRLGQYKHKVEGVALVVAAALRYVYGDKVDWKRADAKFTGIDFDAFKRDALIELEGQHHQSRDDAPAVLRWMIRRYNSNGQFRKGYEKLDPSEALSIRDDFEKGCQFWKDMNDAWRMEDRQAQSDD